MLIETYIRTWDGKCTVQNWKYSCNKLQHLKDTCYHAIFFIELDPQYMLEAQTAWLNRTKQKSYKQQAQKLRSAKSYLGT